jgi:hypothetical protein
VPVAIASAARQSIAVTASELGKSTLFNCLYGLRQTGGLSA